MQPQELLQAMESGANPDKAKILQRFFKTGKGEYGEGDKFWGLTVPMVRQLAKKFYGQMTLPEVEQLLQTEIHEVRLAALEILKFQYAKAKAPAAKKQLVDFYLDHLDRVNNWDLVDLSAPYLLGNYLFHYGEQDYSLLDKLNQQADLWRRRVSIITNLYFIQQQQFQPALRLITARLLDPEDLIHKANGWLLREIGKRDVKVLQDFLQEHLIRMPRTTLRYAIEKFSPEIRRKYLKGEILPR